MIKTYGHKYLLESYTLDLQAHNYNLILNPIDLLSQGHEEKLSYYIF